jgi:hypothetical protein
VKRVAVLLVAALAAGCGRKGPPLPPLVKLPVAPTDFSAVRRGRTVDLQFTVPGVNTDNTRPANVARVDVYALTGGTLNMSEADLIKNATKVASVPVKAPRDPNATVDVDAPPEETEETEPLEGRGFDQGAVARTADELPEDAAAPPDEAQRASRRVDETQGPMLGPAQIVVPSRLYVGVGVNKSGKRGPASRRVLVPLASPPAPPTAIAAAYDEHAVTLQWTAPPNAQGPPENVLPSRPIGVAVPTLGYNIYEVAAPGARGVPIPAALTKSPVAETHFADARMTWGATRCYVVRAVKIFGPISVESDAADPVCVTLKDTFPPAAPKGLTAVAGEGAINLIWDPNDEPDVDGYLVFRGPSPDTLVQVTPQPIHDTTFHDGVPPGAHYVYKVRAVDRAGNASAASEPVEETAR